MEEQNSVQEKNHLCANCHFPLTKEAGFCQKCGQKNTDGRLTVQELFSQFFDNVFNLDSKIFRTLSAVLIPGKLTNAFLDGQRQKYYHPIRFFLVLIVISLASFNYNSNISTPGNLKKEHIDKLKERKRLMDVLDQGINSISENTDQHSVLETLDTLSNIFYSHAGKRVDSININGAMKITDDFDFYIALEDFEKYSPKEILEAYEVKGFYKRLMVQQKIKMLNQGTSFIPFVMGKVTWVVFFVLLLLSLVFKILYFQKDFLYLEHLIFGIHLNSFFLIIISILTFFSEETVEKLLHWIFIFMALYLFIAMKRVYKQSYFISILKFIPILICYFFSFIFGLFLTVVGSFLIF